MKPSIASPPDEASVMTAWPSIAAGKVGPALGRLFALGPRVSLAGVPVKPGWLLALATLPISLFLYFNKIVPRIPAVLFGWRNPWCQRYRLTTHRIVVEHPIDAMSAKRSESALIRDLPLDQFDSIAIETRPGQAWYRAGDLVFGRNGEQVFRLEGVPHPEAFKQACLKAQRSRQGVDLARSCGHAV